MPTWLKGVIGVLFLGLAQPSDVAALPLLVIDQQNDNFTTTVGLGFGAAPLGQEFTPSLSGLDIVEIMIGPRDPSAVAVVNVRKDSITGPLVGTSLPGTFGPTVIHFDFATLVLLVPGDRYVIEPIIVSGLGYGLVFSATDTYPGGRALEFGSPVPGHDMVFREGLSVPEPATFSLLGLGLVFVAGRMGWRPSTALAPAKRRVVT